MKKPIYLFVLTMLLIGCATTSPNLNQSDSNIIPASSPFGFGGPDKEGKIHDTGWFIKFLSLMSGQGIPNTQQSGGNSLNSSSKNAIHKQASLAPDGTYVYGKPTLAPDGTYVGGKPILTPNGKYIGDGSE